MNNNSTSKNTILESVVIFSLLILWIKSLVLLILWSDWCNDDNNFEKIFGRLCDEVLILETIGRNGKSLRFTLMGILCVFTVP